MNTTAHSATKLEAALKELEQGSDVSVFLAKCDCGPGGDTDPRIDLLFARFREDAPDLEALAEFLASQVVNYVVPLKKRKAAIAASGKADFSPLQRLVREARLKFIEFDEKNPGRASEIGELLAFLVAQEWLGAFQVASKMALKTNSNMPVHGLDGIHARFENGSPSYISWNPNWQKALMPASRTIANLRRNSPPRESNTCWSTRLSRI